MPTATATAAPTETTEPISSEAPSPYRFKIIGYEAANSELEIDIICKDGTQSGTIIYAVYNNDGTLAEVSFKKITPNEFDGEHKAKTTFKLSKLPIKLFIWEDESMIPLAAFKDIK